MNHRQQHKWKRDAAIFVVVAIGLILAVVAGYLFLVEDDFFQRLREIEATILTNKEYLGAIAVVLTIASIALSLVWAIIGRFVGHKSHEPRQAMFSAEIQRLRGENELLVQSEVDKDRTIAYQARLLEEYQVHH